MNNDFSLFPSLGFSCGLQVSNGIWDVIYELSGVFLKHQALSVCCLFYYTWVIRAGTRSSRGGGNIVRRGGNLVMSKFQLR